MAQKLDVPCYYKEMTALAAQESGLAKEFISDINSDENAVMRELYLSTSAVRQAVIAQEWGDVHQYELAVDSSIGPEKTAELICGYLMR